MFVFTDSDLAQDGIITLIDAKHALQHLREAVRQSRASLVSCSSVCFPGVKRAPRLAMQCHLICLKEKPEGVENEAVEQVLKTLKATSSCSMLLLAGS